MISCPEEKMMRQSFAGIWRADMDKLVVIFIEGDTEVDFYKKLVSYFREKRGGRLNCCIEVKNVKGVGNYQSKVCRIFEKMILPQYPGFEYHVFLCYDTDAFEFSRKCKGLVDALDIEIIINQIRPEVDKIEKEMG